MKLRTMLLASATVMFAGSAMAADLTNPFFVAEEGAFTSETGIEKGRTEYKKDNGAQDTLVVYEKVEYGVTNNLAVNASIANVFDKEGEYNNDHNVIYDLGVAYNMHEGDWVAQVNAGYMTLDPEDFHGKRAKLQIGRAHV